MTLDKKENFLAAQKYRGKLTGTCPNCKKEEIPHYHFVLNSSNNHSTKKCIDCAIKDSKYIYCISCSRFTEAPTCPCKEKAKEELIPFNRVLKVEDFSKNSEIKIGIEMEFYNYDKKENAMTRLKEEFGNFFHLKFDGSIRDRDGIEVVTNVLSYDFIQNEKKTFIDLFKTMRELGYLSKMEPSCSTHIHIFHKDLTNENLKKILLFGAENPQLIVFLSRRQYLTRFWEISTNRASSETAAKRLITARNSWLNLANPNTIEFRLFGGTSGWGSLNYYLETTMSFLDYAKSKKKESYLKFVKENPKYPILNKYIEESALCVL